MWAIVMVIHNTDYLGSQFSIDRNIQPPVKEKYYEKQKKEMYRFEKPSFNLSTLNLNCGFASNIIGGGRKT